MSEGMTSAPASPAAGGEAAPTQGQSQAQPNAQGKAAPKAATPQADEFEEISIGNVKGKLPKALAKAVKDLERGAHLKFQEIAHERRQNESRWNQFKENPDSFFEAMGMDPDNYSEARLTKKLKEMAMSPEQRKLIEAEAKLQKYESERAEREKAEKAQQEQVAMRNELNGLAEDIGKALDESGLKPDIYLVKQIAALMRESAILTQRKMMERPLTAKEAAARVKQRYLNEQSSYVRNLGPEQILEFLGEDAFKKLREWDVARVTGSAAKTAAPAKGPGDQPASAKAGKIDQRKALNEREWRKLWES